MLISVKCYWWCIVSRTLLCPVRSADFLHRPDVSFGGAAGAAAMLMMSYSRPTALQFFFFLIWNDPTLWTLSVFSSVEPHLSGLPPWLCNLRLTSMFSNVSAAGAASALSNRNDDQCETQWLYSGPNLNKALTRITQHTHSLLVRRHPAVWKTAWSVDFHLLRGHIWPWRSCEMLYFRNCHTLPSSSLLCCPLSPLRAQQRLIREYAFTHHWFLFILSLLFMPLSFWLYFNLPLSVPQLVSARNLQESKGKD